MNINTDISAASNGAYQIRTRQTAITSFDNANPRALAAQQRPATRPADSVQISPKVAAEAIKSGETTDAKAPTKPAPNIIEAIANPGKPSESEANDAPPTFTAADVEAMLSVFGQSYDLADMENADPQVVQYDINGDGKIDADDLNTMLNMIQ